MAVQHVQQVLNWQENLPNDEMPPKWLWGSDAGLVEWFAKVELKRQSKYGRSDNKDSVDAGWEPADSYEDFSGEAREARRMMGLLD